MTHLDSGVTVSRICCQFESSSYLPPLWTNLGSIGKNQWKAMDFLNTMPCFQVAITMLAAM